MIYSTTRSTKTFHLSVFDLHRDAVNNFNDLLHRAILHALLCYDLRNFHDFSAIVSEAGSRGNRFDSCRQ